MRLRRCPGVLGGVAVVAAALLALAARSHRTHRGVSAPGSARWPWCGDDAAAAAAAAAGGAALSRSQQEPPAASAKDLQHAELSARWALSVQREKTVAPRTPAAAGPSAPQPAPLQRSPPAAPPSDRSAASKWWPCECLDPQGGQLAWGRCATATGDAACTNLLAAVPCGTAASGLELRFVHQAGDDVFLTVAPSGPTTGCDVSGHRLMVTVSSDTWLIPATVIPHDYLPAAVTVDVNAAYFRARVRPSWVSAEGMQADAELILDGISA